jgi:hypothetical protein
MRLQAAAAAMVLLAGVPARAHRLDEYLQAAMFSIEKSRVQIQMRLTPGVAVYEFVMAGIDTDGDGRVSNTEQRAYAARMLGDLSLSIDGQRLAPRLVSVQFPPLEDMRQGQGEILIELDAELPRGAGARKLTFENHHQGRIAAYMVNCLVPRDPNLRITAQSRSYTQSTYQLDYVQNGEGSDSPWWTGIIGLVLCGRFALLWQRRGQRRAVLP